ncbi:MAG: triose-phosphate isomerase [Thermodesulfobacteriota bacterium]|nr:triose-phosphate isomerase [Thermodesulfobacteriota bacterium]
MNRRPLIAGNWKMHLTIAEAKSLARSIASGGIPLDRDVMLAPPYTALAAVNKALQDSSVLLASQNNGWEEKGAFTGEISPVMLKDVGCSMAIIGHSERRHIFGESNQLVNHRLSGALRYGLVPILCIGETLEEREANQTFKVLKTQLRGGLTGVASSEADKLVIAYEPVWAIGTGKTASEDQVQEVHAFLRSLLEKMYEKDIASQIRILYGGSVKPDNVDALMSREDVDGALVGGAALQAESFIRIIHFNQ